MIHTQEIDCAPLAEHEIKAIAVRHKAIFRPNGFVSGRGIMSANSAADLRSACAAARKHCEFRKRRQATK